jgi:hypothetical protein
VHPAGTVTDATLSTSDITTNNVSTTKHGFAPKAPNNTTTFLRGDATWATPAGGGATIGTGTEAARPTAGTAGNLYLPSDGSTLERDTGSAWAPWGPIYPFTAPPTTGWTWVNQKTSTQAASVDTTHGGLYLRGGPDSADAWSMYLQTIPATPYTLTVFYQPLIFVVNYMAAGLVLRDSAGTGFITFMQIANNGGRTIDIDHGTGTAVSVQDLTVGTFVPANWFRITDNGTTRAYLTSADGQHWEQMYSQAHATPYTPNQIGIGVDARNGSSLPVAMNLLSWAVT